MPDPRFHHLSLTCDDPIAVERYYTRHFGFRRVRLVPLGETPDRLRAQRRHAARAVPRHPAEPAEADRGRRLSVVRGAQLLLRGRRHRRQGAGDGCRRRRRLRAAGFRAPSFPAGDRPGCATRPATSSRSPRATSTRTIRRRCRRLERQAHLHPSLRMRVDRGEQAVALIPVHFEYRTGLRRPFLMAAQLSGSWNAQGMRSEAWSSLPMQPFTADDGCPAFRATVLPRRQPDRPVLPLGRQRLDGRSGRTSGASRPRCRIPPRPSATAPSASAPPTRPSATT